MFGPDNDDIRAGCFFGPILTAGVFFWLGWLLSALQVPFENVLAGMGVAIIMWALVCFGLFGRE